MSDCIFCRIVAGEIPSKEIYQDDHVYAFRDLSPQAPSHILIVPKKHIASIRDISNDDGTVSAALLSAGNRIADREGIAQSGFRLVVNFGPDSGQTVWHLHFHLVGGAQLGRFGTPDRQ